MLCEDVVACCYCQRLLALLFAGSVDQNSKIEEFEAVDLDSLQSQTPRTHTRVRVVLCKEHTQRVT